MIVACYGREGTQIASAETDEHLFVLARPQERQHDRHQKEHDPENAPPAHDRLRVDQLHSSCLSDRGYRQS